MNTRVWAARSMAAATVLLWSASYAWGQTLLGWLDPITASLARYGLASVVLLVLAAPGGRLVAAWRRGWRGYLAVGVIGTACFQCSLFAALRHTSAVNAAVIIALTPMLALSGEALWRRRRLDARRALGMAACVAGAALAVLGDSPAGLAGLTLDAGEPLALIAAACMAFYTVGASRLIPAGEPPLVATALVMAVGTLCLLPLAGWAHAPAGAPPGGAIAALLALALGSTVLGSVLWMRAVQVLGPDEPNALFNLIPVLTTLGAWWQGQPPYPAQWAGAALVVAGVSLAARSAAAGRVRPPMGLADVRRLAVPLRRRATPGGEARP